ncbi:hypothetical protein LU631_08245 [Erwinia tracheiphila]|nr:hypothetical protein [Erwinia tracheiphila]UIA82526.1 hypothetical protein LU604_18680 [Erwinia tracheiphila]UIA89223.1 hypothetical protein LU631_08245 [Erwinia tracheiphila]UIA91116.1 hypothetical protein LU632_18215 [Erwinia tracheiphila]UIA97605.1 hypothetical protein LU633_06930 [Erwinia tracheiphila]
MAKNKPANLHREFVLLAISIMVAKLAVLMLAIFRAKKAINRNRLI